MSENAKNLIVWLIVLAMVVIAGGVLFFSMPDFAGVERVVYPTEAALLSTTVGSSTESPGAATTTLAPSSAATVAATDTTTIAAPADTFPLNINTATKEQLMEIPGIGEAFAVRIIEYREEIGGYTALEQLLNVKGIGEKRFANWSAYLTL